MCFSAQRGLIDSHHQGVLMCLKDGYVTIMSPILQSCTPNQNKPTSNHLLFSAFLIL